MTAKTTLILDINKHLFAIGVEWGGRGKSASIAAAAAERAEQTKAKFVVLRDNPKQFGMVWPITGAPSLLHPWYSAAAAIAVKHRTNMIGCWRLPNGQYWLLVIGSKGILPKGDAIYPTEQAARAEFEAELKDAYKTRYAPKDWGILGSSPTHFSDLFTDKLGPKFTVPRATGSDRTLKLAIGALIGIAAGAAILFLMMPSRQVVRQVDAPKAVPVLAYADSRATAYNCLARLTGDAEVLNRVPLYTTTDAKCDGKTVTYTLKPSAPANAVVPIGYIQNTYIPAAKVSGDGTSLTLETPGLTPAPGAANPEPVSSVDQLQATLRATADTLLATLSMTPPAPNAQSPGNWQTLSWTIKTSAPAPTWAPALTGDHVRIKTITRTYSAGIYTWLIEGDSYATR